MASVVVKDLRKSFGAVDVIKGVSVDIEDGEFVVLVGPSGCGKSTLLRMIAGLETITAGQLLIDGRLVNDVASKDRDIAMVFQSYALYPHMTVRDNMSFSLKLKRASRAEIDEKVQRAAQVLGLDSLLDRHPRELSGGQRQRVAMGRAIVRAPRVFLFDEPLSNLDAKLRGQMRNEIQELHQRLGTTTIYVTHDQIEAMMMADKIVMMQGGNVAQIGAPLELYDRPANRFVAGFVGSPSMNFLTGQFGDGGFRAVEGFTVPVARPAEIPVGRPVVLGVRPEDIHLSETGVPARLVLVEPTGPDTQVLARIGEAQTLVCVLRGRLAAPAGQMIQLGFTPGSLHFFDPVTEARLPVAS